MGVPMGIPYFQVKKELEKAGTAVFSSNFPLYRDISSRVMNTLRDEVGFVEQYSVDEAFFALEGEEDRVFDALMRIKNAVETRIGVPVSVGAAKTKTIAKYASEVGKKSTGTAIVYGAGWQDATKTLPVHEIWGIGGKTSQKMKEHGIETVADFLASDAARIDKLFGIGGLRLRDELSERVAHRLGERGGGQKSIMSTRSFKDATTDRSVVEDAIAYHVAHLGGELRKMGKCAGSLSVIVRASRHGDWFMRGGSHEVPLLTPTNDTRVLLHEALQLFDTFYEEGVPYKKAGVLVGSLVDESVVQASLFEEKSAPKDNILMQTLDRLNARLGSESVTVGRLQHQKKWGVSKKFVSPCYTTNWNEIAEIKA